MSASYHWALMIGPKKETEGSQGYRYHAKERIRAGGISEFYFEERKCSLLPTSMLLVRIMVGKIVDEQRLVAILRDTPIRRDRSEWNCVSWVQEALEAIRADGRILGTNSAEWQTVRDETMAYCQRKKDQHRFDGQGIYDGKKVPTYDLTRQREIIS